MFLSIIGAATAATAMDLSELQPPSSCFRDTQPSAALERTLAVCVVLRSYPNPADSWLPKNDHPKVRLSKDQHLMVSSPGQRYSARLSSPFLWERNIHRASASHCLLTVPPISPKSTRQMDGWKGRCFMYIWVGGYMDGKIY